MSAEYIKVKTPGGASAQGKPRVYFTCHADDFERSFDKICDKIFAAQNCAVYYTPDMNFIIPEENRATDMERMNLFVIPVSLKLLTTPNRAMDFDFKYAIEKHIPVLPIMIEPGLDPIYSRKDKFGSRQYLDMATFDSTAISFEEKLKKYLSAVLIDDKTAERVRAAFDAYIFLSYRKKDRHYANELMRLIHKNPVCRDIAIWYDEFLTPGEDFNDAIEKALDKSELFALLVTPNLINEKNYVQTTEYPAAKKAQKDILPAEMEPTDKKELQKQYKDIPDCVNAHDDEEFRRRLLESVREIALMENDEDPEHNFLIGLAYLEGIDVEVDRQRALELITKSAEDELPEAMEKLRDMYHDGAGVQLSYQEALKWAKRIVDYNKRKYGEESEETIKALGNLAFYYSKDGQYQEALKINEKVYPLCLKTFDEEHPHTLTSLSNLASTYSKLGQHKKALELNIKAYELSCKVLGEEHPDTLNSLNNLAGTYGELGQHKKALELNIKAYELRCKVLGEEHPDTITSLNNLAGTYGELGQHKKALKLGTKAYELSCKVLGEEHPDTLNSLNNLAGTYGELDQHKKALKLGTKAYELRCKVLGEEHPDTLTSLNILAGTYSKSGQHKKALKLGTKAYELRCKVLGEEHPDTLNSLNNLALTYGDLGQYKKALELNTKAYELHCKVLGEEHPDALTSLNNLAGTYSKLGQYEKALELNTKAYELRCKILGEEHPDTLTTLNNLAYSYCEIGEYDISVELFEKCFSLCKKVHGETSAATLNTYSNLAKAYNAAGNYEKALSICDEIAECGAELSEKIIKELAGIYEKHGFKDKAEALRARLY